MAVSAEAVQTWIAAIEEGYVVPGAWVPWAEHSIEAASYVWPWLVDLFEAETPERASGALCAGLRVLGAG